MNKRELRKFRETYKPWTPDEFISDSVRLAAHFDEKEWIKGLGAKWHPPLHGEGGFWSMYSHNLGKLCPAGTYSIVNIFDDIDDASAGDQTIHEWLNANRMIESIHGDIDPEPATLYAEAEGFIAEHTLIGDGLDDLVNFEVYELRSTTVIRQWHPHSNGTQSNFENWYNVEAGREAWDTLIASGYIPKKEEVAA